MALVAKYLGAGKKSVLLTSVDDRYSIKLIRFDGEVLLIDQPDHCQSKVINLDEMLRGIYKLEIIDE